ncbi:MAG: SDR family oxidoreductase [Candidatus Saganbacteria bacterium]|nr:SDR family oxidoreductase [Candidatus Saganbacteria bacterium]
MLNRLLITGALGHIGSKLIHSFTSDEFEEICLVDNLSTQRFSSLFNLPKGVNFKFINEDICTADLDKYFEGIDVVIHLAAITDAASSFSDPQKVEKVNLNGTERVANACVKNKCKLIFPSTTSVYGVQKDIVDEDCPISNLLAQSPYAESKLKAEAYLSKLGKNDGLSFVICRLGTIFGTSIGMRFHTAINKFCWQAVMGQPITVWRTAYNQKRPYLDLGDALSAIDFIIKNDLFDRRIYNVLTTNTTVKDILDIISNHISKFSIQYVDTKIMNQLSYHVSNKRFCDQGFGFVGDIKQGIEDTINLLKGAYHKCQKI